MIRSMLKCESTSMRKDDAQWYADERSVAREVAVKYFSWLNTKV
jgi:hypothetical protein